MDGRMIMSGANVGVSGWLNDDDSRGNDDDSRYGSTKVRSSQVNGFNMYIQSKLL